MFQYQSLKHIMEWKDRKVEGYRLANTMNQFNIIKIYTIPTQQQDTNSIQVPIDYNPGDTGTYPGTENKVQKCHGLKVLKSYRVCSLITVKLC